MRAARGLALAALMGLCLAGGGCLTAAKFKRIGEAILSGARRVGDSCASTAKWWLLPGAQGEKAPIEKAFNLMEYFWPGAGLGGTALAAIGTAIWGHRRRKRKRADAADPAPDPPQEEAASHADVSPGPAG